MESAAIRPDDDLVRTLVKARTAAARSLEHLTVGLTFGAEIVVRSLLQGGKVLLCGNGGSYAQALHLAAEFTGKLKTPRVPLPALALAANAASLSAVANDWSFEEVFSRELRALGSPTDVLFALSTSGKSENVKRACATATELGVKVVAFAGPAITDYEDYCETVLHVNAHDTCVIQEGHLALGHMLVEIAERSLLQHAGAGK